MSDIIFYYKKAATSNLWLLKLQDVMDRSVRRKLLLLYNRCCQKPYKRFKGNGKTFGVMAFEFFKPIFTY